MTQVKDTLAPELVKYIFMESNKNHFNPQNQHNFRRSPIETIYHGSEVRSYFGQKNEKLSPKN